MEHPWPQDPVRAEARVRGLVDSVVRPGELRTFRLEWVTPLAHRWDAEDAGDVALRVTVAVGVDDDVFQQEIWPPSPGLGIVWTWEAALETLGDHLEDWICETRVAWGQERHAVVPG